MFKLLILLFCLLFSSCQEKEEHVIKIALSSEPLTLDVHNTSSQISRIIMVGNVFERLFILDENGNIIPELCTKFEFSDNKKSCTFYLKENVYFHDGSLMSAEDVVFSLNRWLNSYQNAKTLVGEAFFIKDKNTIKITSENSLLFLPTMLAASPQAAVIIPKQDDSSFTTIGTGPYCFSSWDFGSNIKLKKNDNYSNHSNKEGNIHTLEYYFISDSFVRTSALELGQIDFINDVLNDDILRLSENKNLCLNQKEESGSIVLLLNHKEGIFTNKEARKAVNIGIDFDFLLKACYGESGYTHNPNYMESHQGKWLVESIENYYNLNDKEEAVEILKGENLYGKNIKILSSNTSNFDKLAIALKSELEKLGFTVDLTLVDWATMLNTRQDKNLFDICITAFSTVPLPSLKLFFSPDYPGWVEDEKINSLLYSFNNSETEEDAIKIWEDLQLYSYEYIPIIMLGHYKTTYAFNSKIEKISFNDGFYFYNVKK